eukprot:403356278
MSSNLSNFLKDQEGCKLDAYSSLEKGDTKTIGYGHVMQPGDPDKITNEQANSMLDADIKKHSDYARNAVGGDVFDNLSQNQKDMLSEYSYSLGPSFNTKFPKMTQGILDNDKDVMMKEYKRNFTNKEGNKVELKRRNDAFRDTFINQVPDKANE